MVSETASLKLVDFPVGRVDFIHHLPNEKVTFQDFLFTDEARLLRKAFRLMCSDFNLPKGRAGKSFFFTSNVSRMNKMKQDDQDKKKNIYFYCFSELEAYSSIISAFRAQGELSR